MNHRNRLFRRAVTAAYRLAVVALLSWVGLSCSRDAYESGDSKYSYLRADFVMARTGAAGQVVSAVTDEGESLSLSKPVAAAWATTADSTYRALLYYNRREEAAEPLSISRVPVLQVLLDAAAVAPRHDPVGLQSGWVSADGQFLNLGLLLKTGKSEDPDAVQSVGVVCDSVMGSDVYLRLLHDQGQMPEYYTVRQYVSIPLTGLPADCTLHLTVHTYDGETVRTFTSAAR